MSEPTAARPRSTWRSVRKLMTSTVLLAASAVSLVGLAQALRSPRLSGDSFNRAEFHTRLANVDLDELSDDQLQELARLLERDVTQGRLWLPESPPGDAANAKFHRNFDELAAYWGQQQAADYARLPQEQRIPFSRRHASPMRRLLRASNYLDMRTLTMLAGREPPPAVMDLPRGWVHEELQRWERAAPSSERDEMRRFRQVMEPHVSGRGRRLGDD